MFTKNDLVDAIFEKLNMNKSDEKPVNRIFLSDWEMRKMLQPGASEIRIPANAIISPLALDWIEFKKIKIIRI